MHNRDLSQMFPDVDTTRIQVFAAALFGLDSQGWHEHVSAISSEALERELTEAAAVRERLRPLMNDPKPGDARQYLLAVLCTWLNLAGKPPSAALVAETKALVGRKYDMEGDGTDA